MLPPARPRVVCGSLLPVSSLEAALGACASLRTAVALLGAWGAQILAAAAAGRCISPAQTAAELRCSSACIEGLSEGR